MAVWAPDSTRLDCQSAFPDASVANWTEGLVGDRVWALSESKSVIGWTASPNSDPAATK